MTAQVKAVRLNAVAGTRHRLLDVPAGKKIILRSITYSTNNGTPPLMGLTINGAGFIWDEGGNVSNPTITSADSKTFQLATVLNPGEYLEAQANLSDCYFTLGYVEMDATREGANLHKVYLSNFSASGAGTQTYTVPAGKRFRVRELHCAQHSTSGNVNIYIGGIGYLYRRNLTAHKNEVVHTDISVNAGEGLGAAADAGMVVHLFASGVLEDA